jgi:hypothetical protein
VNIALNIVHNIDPRSKLDAQWTDVRLNGPKEDFWRHEWTKHGTCAVQLEPVNSELKYFSKGTYPQFISTGTNGVITQSNVFSENCVARYLVLYVRLDTKIRIDPNFVRYVLRHVGLLSRP